MNKKYVLLIALLSVLSYETKAGLKLDVLTALERAPLDFVGDLGEGGGVVTDAAAMGKEVYQKGTEAKALFEKVKLKGQNAIETVKSHMPGYGDDEDSASYEEQLAQAEESLANTPSKLKNESRGLDIEMQDRKDALYTEAAGKKQAAEENVNVLKAMLSDGTPPETEGIFYSVISENEKNIQHYQEEMDDIESSDSQILKEDASYQALSSAKETVTGKLDDAYKNAQSKFGDLDANSVTGMLTQSPENRTAQYNKVLKDNFLLVDEVEDAEPVDRVKKHRMNELINAMAKAFVAAVKFKNAADSSEDDTYKIQDNIMGADQQVSTIGMAIEQKIQETKLLHEYNKLVLANMKLKTALNMNNQGYKLKNYDKNPAVLNLDNYVFTEEDVASDGDKKSFLDGVK
jgi:hypothetical protein